MANPSIIKEFFRCRSNIFHFVEKYVVVPTAGGLSKYQLADCYRNLIDIILKKHRVIVLGSRQIGKTTTLEILCAWLMNFFANYTVIHISRTLNQAKEANSDVQFILDNLPKNLFVGYTSKSKTMTVLKNGSKFIVEASKSDKTNNKGRGLRGPFLWIDEAAFIDLAEIKKAVIPVISTQAEIAEKKGLPWGIVFTSTPNGTVGIGKEFYKMWKTAIEDPERAPYYPFKLHWKDVPWCDEKWFEERCRDLNYNWTDINREFNLIFSAGEDSLFSDEVLTKIQPIEPIEKVRVFDIGYIKIFEEINPNTPYVIGIDTAAGYASDNSAIEVVDFNTFNQVAEFVGKCNIDEYKLVIEKIIELFPKSLFVVERNSYGDEILRFLQKIIDSSRIYHHDKKYGLPTTSNTKPKIIDAVYKTVVEDPSRIRSQVLFEELAGLKRSSGQKVVSDINDDTVMAFGFAMYVLTYEQNEVIRLLNIIDKKQTMTRLESFIQLNRKSYNRSTNSLIPTDTNLTNNTPSYIFSDIFRKVIN